MELAANALLFVANHPLPQSLSETSPLSAARKRSMENRPSAESLPVGSRSVTSHSVIRDPEGNRSREKVSGQSLPVDLMESSAASPLEGPTADRLSATGRHLEKSHPRDALRVHRARANPSRHAVRPAEHPSAIVLRADRPAAREADHRVGGPAAEGPEALDLRVVLALDPGALDQVALGLQVDAPPVADRLVQDLPVENLLESQAANRAEAVLPAAASATGQQPRRASVPNQMRGKPHL
jgi:hypothetical protein